ncbi:MAG: hypothetical protein JO107_11175 [Hyphomicrobiales bacterium]|nr:hypothetical protein [Hyphomicrobiales bacterium]MBV8663654.1 hypothetical protein [Hyphomicrobiales bacterium]
MLQTAERTAYALPAGAAHVVGREEVVAEICQKVADRFVSIVGPGGVGKTTVALAAANELLEDFDGAVVFLELSGVSDPELVDQTAAAAFGLPIQSSDPVADLISHLRGKRTLLILDSCEHVLAKVAAMAERLVRQAPDLHILATSREALGPDGEYVLRLPPLESPPYSKRISAADAISFPAVQLFTQRADARSGLNDEAAPLIAAMCRKLGGLPLAIELVAAQACDHDLRETAALLDSHLALRWLGRRTAPRRHHTLSAALDWSYNLLSHAERLVLRQLSVFSGGFTLDAARAVIGGADAKIDAAEVVEKLFAKSLVSADNIPVKRYRLLDSTRAYAAMKLTGDVERQALKRLHALYFGNWLREAAANARSVKRELSLMRFETENVRAALDWAFSASGKRSIAVDLAVCSLPLWLGQALFTECQAWMLKAASMAGQTENVSAQQRLAIHMALGQSATFSAGMPKRTAGTFVRALKLATRLGDVEAQLTCLAMLCVWEVRETWYRAGLATAERRYKIAKALGDPGHISLSEWLVGHCQHHLGFLEDSRQRLQHVLDTDTDEARLSQTTETGYDRKIDTFGVLANTLWTQGFFEQALRLSKDAIDEARTLELPSPLGVALTWAGLNFYLSGVNVDRLEHDMIELVDHGRAHSLRQEEGFGLSILGLLRIERQHYAAGAPMVVDGLRLLTEFHMQSFNPIILAHLAEAAVDAGRVGEAQSFVERMIREDRNAEHWCTPELLRVRALLAIAAGDQLEGERILSDALAMAIKQGALAWRLKIATSFARLRLSQGRQAEARQVLQPVYSSITEGFDTVDVQAATKLLDDLGRAPGDSVAAREQAARAARSP